MVGTLKGKQEEMNTSNELHIMLTFSSSDNLYIAGKPIHTLQQPG